MLRAQKHYEALSIASRIEAAGPHELVAILYQELIRALDVARAALVQNKSDALQRSRRRASSILVALDASLDFDQGGELARRLDQIYRSMQSELSKAADTKEPERFSTVRNGVAELLAAWSKIALPQAA